MDYASTSNHELVIVYNFIINNPLHFYFTYGKLSARAVPAKIMFTGTTVSVTGA